MSFSYEYVDNLLPGENQYDAAYKLEDEKIVNAIYVKNVNATNNPSRRSSLPCGLVAFLFLP